MARTDLARAIARGDAGALTDEVLEEWITAQRWFGSKSQDMSEFNVLDTITLRDAPTVFAIVIVEARFHAGTHELYQVPIGVRPAGDEWADGVIWNAREVTVYDALTDPEQVAVLARRLTDSARIDRPAGCVGFHWQESTPPPDPTPSTRLIGAEQSNSSVVFDERLVLKVFRRLEPGINPELEMLRFLSAHNFEHIAALAGWYDYTGDLMDATLGVMQEFVTPSRDGWDLALDAVAASDETFLDRLTDLGRITGRMHSALASDSSDPDFAPEEPSDENVALLTATIDEQIERLFLDLPDEPALEPILGRGEEVRDRLQMMSHTGVGGRLIRHHGDFHLGQTVYGPQGWVILDFEGEPGRPLLERRRKRSPLRDVAGMLRSFAYVASATGMLRSSPAPDGWEERARETFRSGYMEEVDPSLLPAGHAAIEKLLAIFELEKAIYELRYELNNRPDWVGVPVAGIVRLLEADV